MHAFLLTSTMRVGATEPVAAQLAPATMARITEPAAVTGIAPGTDYFLANNT
jgi:hypothetical protein